MQARTEHWRGRTARFTLAVVVHLIAIFLAYFLSPPIQFKKPSSDLVVMTLPSPIDRKAATQHASRASKTQPRPTPPHTKPPASQVDVSKVPLNLMYVSSDVFRASDISKIHSTPDAPAPGAADGAMADADGGKGAGPGGAKLYPVEWYREPTQAEMETYLPKNGKMGGYGLIACKTAPDYRVENGQEISESPQGSGFARSMRLASWQFRVRPPRIGGKALMGVWIGIRYDLIMGFKK